MSKKVKFDVQGLDSREIEDTMSNVKKVSNGLRRAYKAIDKVDKEKGDQALVVDYADALDEALLINVKEILGLDAKSAKKLEDLSLSGLRDFYKALSINFVGLEYPTIDTLMRNLQGPVEANGDETAENTEQETVDPKSKDEN